jgi:hypothetical protein
MNEQEKKIAEKILKRIDGTLNSKEILNYLRFLEAVCHRVALDDPNRRF